jgi:hypothetical protein
VAQLVSARAWGARGRRGGAGHPDTMKPLSKSICEEAIRLRRAGFSHRDIANKLKISLGSAFKHTKEIKLTPSQHLALMRRNIPKPTMNQKIKGGKNNPHKFMVKYAKEDLIKIVKNFVKKEKRIPTKREVPQYRAFLRVFGTWNNEIRAAGFQPNSNIFTKKFIANDGHKCDSLSEKIIDDWLWAKKINHQINVSYPENKKLTVDFLIKDYWVEFFGLSGELKKYDTSKTIKIKLAKKYKLKLIEIYPRHLFPKNKLSIILKPLKNFSNNQ